MTEFRRKLPINALNSLRELTTEDNSWWTSLLENWVPSGRGEGLRLAIRSGYLNFYAKGQSIAKITFGRRGKSPAMSIHAKYVTGDKNCGQKYEKFLHRGRDEMQEGSVRREWPKMLQKWISRSECFSENEKKNIDALIAEWPKVIDIEMGLPAFSSRKSALRVDMVSLEGVPEGIHLVFWEAKMIGNQQLRSRCHKPKVFEQIDAYHSYLADPTREEQVIKAYRECCGIIRDLHDMASAAGTVRDLDPMILAAANPGSRLSVERSPRLVIFDDGEKRNKDAWQEHLEVLRSKVPVTIIPSENPID